ncbi:MAG: MoaD/ThiS family protein [Sphingomonadales bacterium]|jgi:molybdopterin synthase sulfur carrier subunit|nr:MoaD/ThiS family protein [Sphingomonadales bacterium]MBK9002934.1 MoaD/ThiS family protein [Sphingomonadales bacterium]MBK9268182.1 MoaD/ThiS family protein [Sphingomonadales bacterium]
MKLVYFARVREALGCDGEDVDFPAAVQSVGDALDWLVTLSPRHADAFADRSKLRFALDQRMVKSDALVAGASEFAIFPPVTGG